MNAKNTCRLQPRTDWDASSFIQRPELVREPRRIMSQLGGLAAPLYPGGMQAVLSSRRDYFQDRQYRERLAFDIAAWHRSVNAPEESVQNCERLRDSDAWLVTTGQQPGLLLGPMYTLIKALQTICLAQRLTSEGHGAVLPAFWIASEDHQIGEMDRAVWLGPGRGGCSSTRSKIPGRKLSARGPEAWIASIFPNSPRSSRNPYRNRTAGPAVLKDLHDTYSGSLADWFQRLLVAVAARFGADRPAPRPAVLSKRPRSGYSIQRSVPR